MAVAIETREHTGKSGKTYQQFFSDGRMVGCGCAEAKAVCVEKYGFKPCKHMLEANTPRVEVEPFVPEYSCELCGRRVGRAYMVCAKCGGV